jgi:hypothetical protein
MDNILPLFADGAEIVHIPGDVDLRRFGLGAPGHAVIELLGRQGLAQVVWIIHAVQHIVKADVSDPDALKMLLCQIRCGAAAQNIIRHRDNPFPFAVVSPIKAGLILP